MEYLELGQFRNFCDVYDYNFLVKVSWVAAELGMSGDGNDEEIVKLSIEGKVITKDGVSWR